MLLDYRKSLSMTRYLAALDRRRHHRRRPDPAKPTSSSVAPPELHRRPESANTNPLKRMAPPATSPACGQLPLHRPGGPSRSSRSVGIAPPNLSRARDSRQHDQRCQIPLIFPSSGRSALREQRQAPLLSVLQNLAIVVDDPVPRCARPAPAPSPPSRPGEADVIIGRTARAPSSPRICEHQSAKKNGAAGDLTSVRPAAAAPTRRPEQVEQIGRHRAAQPLARARQQRA